MRNAFPLPPLNSPSVFRRIRWATMLCGLSAGLGLLLLAGSPTTAFAASSLDPSSIMSATPSTDQSIKMLNYVFGSFSQNPFTLSGSPTTLLGKIFLYLNTFIFFMAALWSTYTITGGVVGTAHEGEFLGKRYSTVWYPIRLVWGAATLVPIFGGFSLGQAIYMFFVLLSIGAANGITSVGIDSMNDFTSMVSAPSSVPASSKLDSDLADVLFRNYVCANAIASESGSAPIQPASQMKSMPIGSGGSSSASASGGLVNTIGLQLGTDSDPTMCGTVSVSANSGQTSSTTLGFSVNSVNYQGITSALHSAVLSAHQTALNALSQTISQAASTWYTQFVQNKTSGTQITPYPTAQLQQARQAYNTTVQQALTQALQSSQTQAFTSQAIQNMKSTGWAGLGSWYETFAEANSAMADATKVEFSAAEPTAPDSAWADAVAGIERAKTSQLGASGGAGSDKEQGVMAKVMSYLTDKLCGGMASGTFTNSTGNVSLGQCLLGGTTSLIFRNSGGNQLVDPIIASKNLGDYLMVSGEILWAVGEIGATLTQSGGDNSEGFFTKMLSNAPVVGTGVKLASLIGAIGAAVARVALTLSGPILVIGMVMSIYIPLIPFITWFSGLLTWLAVIVESIIASPIWSMAHAEGDGEGMGRRSEHGYLFLLNVMFRAPLMVVAFFVAAASTVIMGTVLFMFFGPAIANAAGNSVVGLLSIIGYLIILCGTMILIVQTSFNLIHLIPDQVLGWIGGNLGAHLGRELEGRTHTVVVAGVRSVQSGLMKPGGLGKLKPAAPSAAPAGIKTGAGES
ncbi:MULTISPECIES: DotA/TraY family protein [unclassified Burkholderia]|uniref:DotA/TraY family protein n=1 Tax=unclassified Burkholderia TaxID=2613784 RepID=UPI002AAFF297|nr:MULTISPECIES: DotA/TraY family protein [unclassified Burkholderia]